MIQIVMITTTKPNQEPIEKWVKYKYAVLTTTRTLYIFFPSEVYRPLLVQFSAAFLATQLA
jgi:hypothetical protein